MVMRPDGNITSGLGFFLESQVGLAGVCVYAASAAQHCGTALAACGTAQMWKLMAATDADTRELLCFQASLSTLRMGSTLSICMCSG
jgi:hypothetical protein